MRYGKINKTTKQSTAEKNGEDENMRRFLAVLTVLVMMLSLLTVCEAWADDEKKECKHGDTEIIPAVAPTCTETGLTEGRYCTLCKKVLKKQEVVRTRFCKDGKRQITEAQNWRNPYNLTR